MKTPDEIKKGLETHESDTADCIECPYEHAETQEEWERCVVRLEADALAYIQQLEAKVPKWISFREALPPAHRRVLCLGTDKGKPYVYIDVTLSFGCTAYSKLYAPTHWMPLPEPPTEV